jgi:hypothetical protein
MEKRHQNNEQQQHQQQQRHEQQGEGGSMEKHCFPLSFASSSITHKTQYLSCRTSDRYNTFYERNLQLHRNEPQACLFCYSRKLQV